MPLSNAVSTSQPRSVRHAAGPRQTIVLVAAQRDMIERLLAAVREAVFRPEGVDSRFALIRSPLPRARRAGKPDHEQVAERVLYLNVDGLTNLAHRRGASLRFTPRGGPAWRECQRDRRATRHAIAEARELVAAVDLGEPAQYEPAPKAGTLDRASTPPHPNEDAAADVSGAEDDSAKLLARAPGRRNRNPDVRMVSRHTRHCRRGCATRSTSTARRWRERYGIVISGSALDLRFRRGAPSLSCGWTSARRP